MERPLNLTTGENQMNIEFGQLEKDVTTLLAPFLPYLATAGTEGMKEIGKDVGKAIPAGAKKIWEVLNYNIELKPPLKKAVNDVAESPKDEKALKRLDKELGEILKADGDLAHKLVELLQNTSADTQRKYNVHAEKIQGFVQGDHAKVEMKFGDDS